MPYSYPVPTLGRDAALAVIQPWLTEHDIYSRGRFGAWRYEIGNTDHSVMMGVEVVDHLLKASPRDDVGLASRARGSSSHRLIDEAIREPSGRSRVARSGRAEWHSGY